MEESILVGGCRCCKHRQHQQGLMTLIRLISKSTFICISSAIICRFGCFMRKKIKFYLFSVHCSQSDNKPAAVEGRAIKNDNFFQLVPNFITKAINNKPQQLQRVSYPTYNANNINQMRQPYFMSQQQQRRPVYPIGKFEHWLISSNDNINFQYKFSGDLSSSPFLFDFYFLMNDL
jgi:hypothetical protein